MCIAINKKTIGGLYESLVSSSQKQDSNLINGDKSRWSLYLSKLSDTIATDVSKSQLQKIVDEVPDLNQAYLCCSLLNRIYEHSITVGSYSGRNPAQSLQRHPEKIRERLLNPEEMKLFIESIKDEGEPWASYFLVYVFVRQSRSNIISMRWADLDLVSGVWSIKNKHKTINLTLHNNVIELLRKCHSKAINQYVFSSTNSTGHIVSPQKAFHRICDRASIGAIRIYDLRRSLSSYQITSKVQSLL